MIAGDVPAPAPRTLALCLSLFAASSRAQTPPAPPRWRLSWTRGDGAESCPAAAEMESRVRARLGRDPFHHGEGPALEAVVEREDREWVARLYARDGATGARELRSDDARCDAIADTAALAMALVIDPEASLDATPARPAPRAAPPVNPVTPRASRGGYAVATAQWVAAPGLLQGFTWAAGFAVQAHVHPVWHLDAGAWLVAPQTTQGADAFELSSVMARLGVCATVARARRVDVDVCAGATAGWVSLAAVDPLRYAAVSQGARVTGALGATAGLTWRAVGPLVLRVELGAQVPWVRPSFVVTGASGAREVFQSWPVVPWFALGPGLRF